MNDDAELLRRYAEERSDAAFAEFVRRQIDFVYGCALRRVGGDAHFAEDVTQLVFAAAARDARQLARHPVLSGWLFTATRNTAAQLVRTERRRHAREQEAYAMNPPDHPPALDWDRLKPVLDEALDGLNESDRQAVLLRFFENRSFAEIGGQLRVAENTARMRVDRALDRLSQVLRRRGVTSTAAALAAALASQPGIAAPAGLAASATTIALTGAAGGGIGGGGAIAVFMSMTKLQVGVAAAALVAGATGWVVQGRQVAALQEQITRDQTQIQAGAAIAAENVRLQEAQRDAIERARADAATLAQLQAETAELRQRIEQQDARKPVARRVSAYPGKAYDVRALEQIPQPTTQLPPLYPFEMRRLGIRGEATVDFVVDADGAVQNASVIKASDPAFGDAAVEAIQQWKFKPGQLHGQSVATHMQIPIVFTLSDGKRSQPNANAPADRSVPWF